MNQKTTFNKHIKSLMLKEQTFVYKANVELLKQFYNTFINSYQDEEMANVYLEMFDSVESIKCSNIESNFSSIITEHYRILTYDFDEEKYLTSGIYFIFDESSELLYVGKTTNLLERPFVSFLNKLPYGSHHIKMIDLHQDIIGLFEAIAIDYFLPIYNNKMESFKVAHRTYTDLVEVMKEHIKNTKPIKVDLLKKV